MLNDLDRSLQQFNDAVDEFSKKIPDRLVELQQKIGLEALRRIVYKTPVDTGRARGNWQVTIDKPAVGVLVPAIADPVGQGGLMLADLPPFTTVWITNNVPYIKYLEDGSSKQAPQGMVSVTLGELKAMFE